MQRRTFIAGTAALLISLRCSRAQGKRRRLGFLALGDGSGKALNQAELALFDGLRRHGWIDGENLAVEYRFSQPPDRLSSSVDELIALRPDVLIAAGPRAAEALKSAAATIPIVFVAVFDPVGLGLVRSLSRPGGNITGLATSQGVALSKSIDILRELVPGASNIAILVNRGNPMHRLVLAEEVPRTARNLGIALQIVEATTPEELDTAFASAADQRAEALIVLGDALTVVQGPRVVELAAKHRLPALHLWRQFAIGGLIVYGPDVTELFRRAGAYVDKIFKGAKPADIPVELPIKYELVINMRTAKALGLSVPTSLLLRADEVIE
ncbi:ABC transporter substrate-binding protein [Bradyrhizobium sp. CCGE-LA001]|uniref:ABC transporter substrate-binding protein n=1 Tax=Bradyrhizobium sp. CCGE-LA001 TaxID=1223566 RepID=UPI000745D205|nr:ABC transporter substrate-binding protein [Bradyrhizobium sp. CCGE-LA001]AMA59630.1 ABC transporter substrate-binding protein [Bradyrhizobium sp. CCGE-LA001]